MEATGQAGTEVFSISSPSQFCMPSQQAAGNRAQTGDKGEGSSCLRAIHLRLLASTPHSVGDPLKLSDDGQPPAAGMKHQPAIDQPLEQGGDASIPVRSIGGATGEDNDDTVQTAAAPRTPEVINELTKQMEENIDTVTSTLHAQRIVSQPTEHSRNAPTPSIGPAPVHTVSPVVIPSSPPVVQVSPQHALKSGKVIFTHLEANIKRSERDRFQDLIRFVNEPLYEYLVKKGMRRSRGSISIDLHFVGKDEARAKLTMVVFCEGDIRSKVKKFFRERQIRSEYQPSPITPEKPWYELVFAREGPRRYALPTVPTYIPLQFADQPEMEGESPGKYPKGFLVIFRAPGGSEQLATMGGVVSVKAANGGYSYYGMTAGHPISGLDDYNEEDEDDHDSYGSGSEDIDSSSSEDDDEFEGSSISEGGSEMGVEFEGQTEGLVSRCRPFERIGDAFRSPLTVDKLNLDWGLVSERREEGNTLHIYNLRWHSRIPRQHEGVWSPSATGSTLTPSEMPQSGREVFFCSGMNGYQEGRLHFLTSALSLPPGRGFTRTHKLQVAEDAVLQPGDCGAWVVDKASKEVYGHIVASNNLNQAYVVPLQDSLDQIREVLGATGVLVYPHYVIPSGPRYEVKEPQADPDLISPPVSHGAAHSSLSQSKKKGALSASPDDELDDYFSDRWHPFQKLHTQDHAAPQRTQPNFESFKVNAPGKDFTQEAPNPGSIPQTTLGVRRYYPLPYSLRKESRISREAKETRNPLETPSHGTNPDSSRSKRGLRGSDDEESDEEGWPRLPTGIDKRQPPHTPAFWYRDSGSTTKDSLGRPKMSPAPSEALELRLAPATSEILQFFERLEREEE
ncbi:hypothetical protein TWF481_011683 [Arthrobotrys musiformis]|uniref:Uncharacterized protein n=1 Tax=Arthrobotrys musiformis TaxID=47236 RepID=A0AAV9W0F7_9PEZI